MISKVEYMQKKIIEYRKGFFCSLCDYDNHKYINIPKKEIQISKEFCWNLVDDFIDILDFKYSKIYKILLAMDEIL